jgi:hypothetical protein
LAKRAKIAEGSVFIGFEQYLIALRLQLKRTVATALPGESELAGRIEFSDPVCPKQRRRNDQRWWRVCVTNGSSSLKKKMVGLEVMKEKASNCSDQYWAIASL